MTQVLEQKNTNHGISSIIHGYWRCADWKLSTKELNILINQVIDLGINTFDHADIYGNYSCEKLFGDALAINKEIRNKIKIITKCGIKPVSNKFPDRNIKTYDYSKNHLISSVEQSLINFRTDTIDLLLLHRPSPLLNPEEVAEAFSELKRAGKVLQFGVSNFNSNEFEMLDSIVETKLITNQLELSAFHLAHFNNGTLNSLQKNNRIPMAWSPLAGGKIAISVDEKGKRISKVLNEIAWELNCTTPEIIALAWLFKHPSKIIPILGSSKIERIRMATNALDIKLSNEQWFRIYNASSGVDLP